MNHKYVCRFNDYNCIDKVVNIDEATFERDKLKKYILSSNSDIDKINIFSKIRFYNYNNQKELNKMFTECVDYILKYIDKNLI